MKTIPIVNPSSEHLFSEVVEKKEVEIVKGIFVKTGALKFGQTFDLISVCQSPLLIDKGFQDFTDVLGETIRLTKIYFKAICWSSEDGDSSDDIRVIDVTEEPGAAFHLNGDGRIMNLYHKFYNGTEITGSLNRETGKMSVFISTYPGFEYLGFDISAELINPNRVPKVPEKRKSLFKKIVDAIRAPFQ